MRTRLKSNSFVQNVYSLLNFKFAELLLGIVVEQIQIPSELFSFLNLELACEHIHLTSKQNTQQNAFKIKSDTITLHGTTVCRYR